MNVNVNTKCQIAVEIAFFCLDQSVEQTDFKDNTTDSTVGLFQQANITFNVKAGRTVSCGGQVLGDWSLT